jgi:hypothetical protein
VAKQTVRFLYVNIQVEVQGYVGGQRRQRIHNFAKVSLQPDLRWVRRFLAAGQERLTSFERALDGPSFPNSQFIPMSPLTDSGRSDQCSFASMRTSIRQRRHSVLIHDHRGFLANGYAARQAIDGPPEGQPECPLVESRRRGHRATRPRDGRHACDGAALPESPVAMRSRLRWISFTRSLGGSSFAEAPIIGVSLPGSTTPTESILSCTSASCHAFHYTHDLPERLRVTRCNGASLPQFITKALQRVHWDGQCHFSEHKTCVLWATPPTIRNP